MSPQTFEEDLYENFANLILGEKLPLDICESQTGRVLIPAHKKINKTMIKDMVKNYFYLEIDPSPVRNRFLETVYRVEKKWGK